MASVVVILLLNSFLSSIDFGFSGGGFIPALALRASVLFAVVWSGSEIVVSGFPLSRE